MLFLQAVAVATDGNHVAVVKEAIENGRRHHRITEHGSPLADPSKLARGHHPAIPYEDVAAFIAKLRKREATAAMALELCILTAARSGEVLGMRWSEIDFDKKIWTVPANRMKVGAMNSRRRINPSPSVALHFRQ